MVRTASTEKRARVGRFRGVGVLLPVGLILLSTGCTALNRLPVESVPAHDPLRGGPPIQPVTKPGEKGAATLGTPVSATPKSDAPKTDGPKSNSPAAMASGSNQPLDPSRSLQIGAPQPEKPASGDAKEWKGPNITGSGSGDTTAAPPPSSPISAPPPTARSAAPWPASRFSASASHRVGTYEQAQAILASRRVTWQRLETWGDEGEWKFSCSIPNQQNAHIRRTYEARAAEPIAALQAVLEKIEKENR